MTSPGASIHDLLVHREFLRRLVRDLVSDEAGQQDLTQQVWLQALRTPPRDARGLRGWLATTARNLIANTRRSDARREVRETASMQREHAPATDEILARESVRESVLRAVLALDEPFREAVLLRYYEGLAPREIAARLGVPDATVRTRVARGLERLRGRLDAQHVDRGTWALAALPLARVPDSSLGLSGVIVVKKIAVAIALLVLALVTWRVAVGDRSEVDVAGGDGAVAQAERAVDPRGTAPSLGLADLADERRAATVNAPSAPRGPRTFPAQRGRGSIHGLAVDTFDAPLAGVVVRARPHMGGTAPGIAIDDDRTRVPEVETDASGRFRLVDVDEGPVRVEATFPDGSVTQHVIVLGANEDAGPLRFAPEDARPPAPALEVLVVDAHGAPVPDVHVEAFGWTRTNRDPVLVDAHSTHPAARGTSGVDGRAVLDGSVLASGVAIARSIDGRAGWSSFLDHAMQRTSRPLRIALAPTGSLLGVITGVSDEALRGARLSLHALSTLEPYHAAAGHRFDIVLQSANFEARDLPAGTYAITLDAPAGARLVHPPMSWGQGGQEVLENSIAHVTAIVEPGRASHIELAAALGARLRGRVTVNGASVTHARIRAVLAPRTMNFAAGFVLHGVHVWRFDGAGEQAPYSSVSHRVVRTDEDGRYEFPNLSPGRWRVEVAADGLTLDRRLDVELAEGTVIELEHALVEAGVLQIGTIESSYLGVFPAEGEKPVMLAVVRDGCATFAGLAPGRYRIASVHSDEKQPHLFLGEATVEAGLTTWIDLRAAAGRVRVHGVVRVDGAPLVGANVVLYPANTTTDAAGSFEIRRLRTPRFEAGFGSSIKVHHAGLEHVFVPANGPGAAERELELDLMGGALDVEVVDSDGQQVAARIEATWTPTTTSPTGPTESNVRTGASDGRFTLAPLGPGRLTGRVTYPDGWSAWFESAIPRAEPLRFERPHMGTLTVRALRGGRPVEGVRVALEAAAAAGAAARWEQTLSTDAAGKIVVETPSGDVAAQSRGGFLEPGKKGMARVEPGGTAEIVLELDG